MAVARAYGVPRSTILGESTRSVTTVEYDEAGRKIREVTVHESPWSEDDFGYAAAYEQELADECPRCGQPLSETTAMKDGEPVHSYFVDHAARCYSCDELIKQEEEDLKKGHIRPLALMRTSQRMT